LCKGIDDAVSLTERDVRNVTFAKPRMGNRGYDEDEVDTFLDLVERELARRQDIQRRYLEAGG
jgi:DivIVA domain-containing protein